VEPAEEPTTQTYQQRKPRSDGSAPVGADDDLKTFAVDGLVIDTRELFQLIRAVKAGRMRASDARHRLRSSTGVFGLRF
jgi:hypothetical protein